jgi:histone H3/H4
MRGEFRPDEDEQIGFWLGRYLSVRSSLWEVIHEALVELGDPAAATETGELRTFVIGYCAICVLVRIDRIFLFDVAHHSVIQRKLNEPFPEYRIPKKQYTKIFEAFINEGDALNALRAIELAKQKRKQLLELRGDEEVGFLVEHLDELEKALIPSKRRYFKDAWAFVSHKWRRLGVVSMQKLLAAVLEGLGRTASEFAERDNKKVTAEVRASIGGFLECGDVLVTRHEKALTNLFIPGYWPHAALYIGTPAQRRSIGARHQPENERLGVDSICALEALKDGAQLRPLSETLAVDAFVVLRPRLQPDSIARAVERAVAHEGKMYNFDFDFFSSDRLVCTEVVYRAYDGLEDLRFPLQERAGRKTLSAEDLLDFALDDGAFEPVAIFGVEGCEDHVEYDERARAILLGSYRG